MSAADVESHLAATFRLAADPNMSTEEIAKTRSAGGYGARQWKEVAKAGDYSDLGFTLRDTHTMHTSKLDLT